MTMRRCVAMFVLFISSSLFAQTPITFDVALQRAMKARGVDTAFNAGISRLERPFGPMLPTIRVEAAAQRAESIELASNGMLRFDAMSVLLAVDYPLFARASRDRRLALARTSGQLFRRRALDESDEIFRETLDAFVDLYVAQQRMALLEEGVKHASVLRERARTMLELQQITTTTAANWEEQALGVEAQRLDQELSRLDAETRLKQLMGNVSNETFLPTLDLDTHVRETTQPRELVDRATLIEAQKQLVFEELESQRRPQFLASAFGGVASVPESFRNATDDNAYGIYGLRLTFTLPSFDAAAAARLVEAQLDLEDATRARNAAATAKATRGELLTLSMTAARRRAEILEQQIALAKRRQESMTRLVVAGVRTEGDLFDAVLEVNRRESELLAIRAEQWKLEQTARHEGSLQ